MVSCFNQSNERKGNKMSNKGNNQSIINTMAKVYADTNSASHIVFCKPMAGTWYGFTAPMTAQNIANLISTVETSDEGYKARFRPSNGAFYRSATAANAEVFTLASVEYVDNRVSELSAQTGSRINRGNVVEELIAHKYGDSWSYNPLQRAYYDIPDVVASDGKWIQVKAYGASITEKDLQDAIATLKSR